VCFVVVNTIDCKSQCNASVVARSSTPATTTTTQRPASARSLALTSSAGFLRVDRSATGQCPRARQQSCAVTLRASPGQRINVTLWDFTMTHDRRVVAAHRAHGVETCYRCARTCVLCVCVCVCDQLAGRQCRIRDTRTNATRPVGQTCRAVMSAPVLSRRVGC